MAAYWPKKTLHFINMVLMLFMLFGCCVPSLSEVDKAEGQGSEGDSGYAQNIDAEVFHYPPSDYDLLKLWLPDGSKQVGIVSYIMITVQDMLDGAVEEIYRALTEGTGAENVLSGLFAMMIAFYGIAVSMGIASPNWYTVIVMLLKMMVIYAFVTDYDLFATFVKDIVEDVTGAFIAIMGEAISEGQGTDFENEDGENYKFLDQLASVFFSQKMIKMFSSLFTSGGAGWIYGLVLGAAIAFFFMAVIRALHIVVVAMVARSLLFAMAPIFMTFILFNGTRDLFNGWLKQIINFTLQLIILFAFLGFFTTIITGFLNDVAEEGATLAYGSTKNMPGNAEIFKVFCPYVYDEQNTKIEGHDADIPLNLFNLMLVAIMAFIMSSMHQWVLQVSSFLSQGASGRALEQLIQRSFAQRLRERTTQTAGALAGAGKAVVTGHPDEMGVNRRGAGAVFKAGADAFKRPVAGGRDRN